MTPDTQNTPGRDPVEVACGLNDEAEPVIKRSNARACVLDRAPTLLVIARP